jgi:mRNA interferase RelE/StbE
MKTILSPAAEKQLRRLPKTSQIIVAKRIRQLREERLVQVEKLSGFKNTFRTRVGVYRIVCKKFANSFYVILIGHRREVYKLLRSLFK